jgi:hypothetical protein
MMKKHAIKSLVPASAWMGELPDGQISDFSVQTPSEKYFA